MDCDGRTNLITYDGYFPKQIARISDPYGRTVDFGYDAQGRLTSITNAVGMVDRFTYDSQGMILSLITIHGTNTFKAVTNSFGATNLGGTNQVNRALEVTNPDGSKELFLYRDQSTKLNPNSSTDLLPASYSGGEVPNTSPLSNTLDNSYLDARNTFHWNPLQYSLLSSGFRSSNLDFNQITLTDYKYATVKHWMRDSANNLKPVPSLLRSASPDGTASGQKIWFDYAGKTASYTIGTNRSPSFETLVQPDSSTLYSYTERLNAWERPTRVISTYATSGSVGTRTNVFVYASDGIDLLKVTNAIGLLVSSNTYNSFHQVTSSHNALSERTDYTYGSYRELTEITWPTGCTRQNSYYPPYVTSVRLSSSRDYVTGSYATPLREISFSYWEDTIYSVTTPLNLTVTSAFDALRRPTTVTYPSGTFSHQ